MPTPAPSPPTSGTPPPAPPPPGPTPEPAPAPAPLRATVTITAAGFEPKEVVVAAGGRVTFVNDDARPHVIVSDPEFLHDQCPPINEVSYLNSGQRKDSGVLDVTPACGFHDHFNEFNNAFKGTIVVRDRGGS